MSRLRHFSLATLAVLAAVRPAYAQRVLGIGEDASTLPRGVWRVTAGVVWDRANERYDADGKLRALGAAASTSSWNGRYDPRLGTAGPLVAALSGLPDFDASLGVLSIARRDASVDAPLGLELGVLSRLTVGAQVRVASHAIEPSVGINPGRIEGAMGFNPAWTNTTARDRNSQLLAQFDSATAQTTRRIVQCQASPTTAGCASVLANVPGAQALVANAGAFASALNQLYGGRAGAAGLPFVPVGNGVAQQAINQRVQGYRDQFTALGNGAIGTQGPAGSALFSPSDVTRLLGDSLYGYLLRPMRAVHAYGPGEIAVRMKLLLFQTTGDDTAAIRGFAVRQSAGASLRLLGGSDPAADEAFAPTTGEGSSGFGAQSFTDLWYGNRLSASIVLGFDQGQAQEFVTRIPDAATPSIGGAPFPILLGEREVTLSRTPGSRLDITVTPRVSLTRNIWIGGSWAWSQQGAESWGVTASRPEDLATLAADAQAWAAGTDWSEHRLGLGGTYSTVAAARAGRARWAFDVTYQHQQTSIGRGWRVPRITRDVVSVRWYPRFWGR
ncbi:MAG: hypothetical protein AAB224_08585 [Gemmatimonadota bacterium]